MNFYAYLNLGFRIQQGFKVVGGDVINGGFRWNLIFVIGRTKLLFLGRDSDFGVFFGSIWGCWKSVTNGSECHVEVDVAEEEEIEKVV